MLPLRPAAKPRVVMLADRRGWAFDFKAQSISRCLSDEFDIQIAYVRDKPDLSSIDFDLLYIFFWGETYHHGFGLDSRRVVKEISSHRWANESDYGYLTPAQATRKYLADAGTITSTSERLLNTFTPYREVHYTPNGFDPDIFKPAGRRTGALRIGWAGDRNDRCKGLNDILLPAAEEFELQVADGGLGRDQMREFYNSIDVICVASTAEGTPFPLLEGMACGCFPVAVDVGIVPEVVRSGSNGLVIKRKVAAFRKAFRWCAENVEQVRAAGLQNAEEMLRTRTWGHVTIHWREALRAACRDLANSAPDGSRREG
ncbi:MAG: glycosyltransferase family 4 protein [Thermoleophilia bacterium]|nr:glycosyltransferase family 4 protein [Thermoleophilia bacterium]